jgi:hypothetical protein
MLLRAMIVLFALLGILSGPLAADTIERSLVYTVSFRGLGVAEITGAARETDDAYAAAVQIRSTGLAAAFARVRFDMQVEGFRAGDALSPYHYRDAVDTGQRQGAVELLWPAGEGPVLLSDRPEVEPGVRPVPVGEASGAQDRLTILWRLTRPQPDGALCDWQATLFDGARLAALSVGPPRFDGDSASCSGAYTRLAGFPAAELAEAPRFPFDVTYGRGPTGLWELTEASAASIYGRVRIFTKD